MKFAEKLAPESKKELLGKTFKMETAMKPVTKSPTAMEKSFTISQEKASKIGMKN